MGQVYKEQDVRSLLRQAEAILGQSCEEVPIIISPRMSRSYGVFLFRIQRGRVEPVAFKFALRLLSGDYEDEVVRQVIFHEYAHFYTNTFDHQNHGHDEFFKANCRRLGIPEETKLKVSNEAFSKKPGYIIRCSNCGSKVATRRRKDATATILRRYRSGCCNKPLTATKEIF